MITPAAMITIFDSYVFKHYKTMLGIFIPAWVTGVPSNYLEKLLFSKMELGQNVDFYELSVIYIFL